MPKLMITEMKYQVKVRTNNSAAFQATVWHGIRNPAGTLIRDALHK